MRRGDRRRGLLDLALRVPLAEQQEERRDVPELEVKQGGGRRPSEVHLPLVESEVVLTSLVARGPAACCGVSHRLNRHAFRRSGQPDETPAIKSSRWPQACSIVGFVPSGTTSSCTAIDVKVGVCVNSLSKAGTARWDLNGMTTKIDSAQSASTRAKTWRRNRGGGQAPEHCPRRDVRVGRRRPRRARARWGIHPDWCWPPGAGLESVADLGNLDTKRGLTAVPASAKRSIRSTVDNPWLASKLHTIHGGRPQSQIVDTAREPLWWIVASMRRFSRHSEPAVQFHLFRSLMSGAMVLAISTDRVRLCLMAPGRPSSTHIQSCSALSASTGTIASLKLWWQVIWSSLVNLNWRRNAWQRRRLAGPRPAGDVRVAPTDTPCSEVSPITVTCVGAWLLTRTCSSTGWWPLQCRGSLLTH